MVAINDNSMIFFVSCGPAEGVGWSGQGPRLAEGGGLADDRPPPGATIHTPALSVRRSASDRGGDRGAAPTGLSWFNGSTVSAGR